MNIYYNVTLNMLTDNKSVPLQTIPQLVYGDVPMVVFAALDTDNSPVDLSSAVTWNLSIDVDRTDKTKPVCEIPSNSITYDETDKTLSWLINTKTSNFFSMVDGKDKVALIAELCGYDSGDALLFRFTWNMIGLMPATGGAVPESDSATGDYSAFEVYANSEEIPAGTEHSELGYVSVAIPAQMTEKFTIRHIRGERRT